MNRLEFEELVRQAVESLPDRFLERLDNVDVVVEDRPSRDQRRANTWRRMKLCSDFTKASRKSTARAMGS